MWSVAVFDPALLRRHTDRFTTQRLVQIALVVTLIPTIKRIKSGSGSNDQTHLSAG